MMTPKLVNIISSKWLLCPFRKKLDTRIANLQIISSDGSWASDDVANTSVSDAISDIGPDYMKDRYIFYNFFQYRIGTRH